MAPKTHGLKSMSRSIPSRLKWNQGSLALGRRSATDIAIFVDGDSIGPNHADRVLRSIQATHRICAVRVHGNLNGKSVGSWSHVAKERGVFFRHLPKLVQGKNAADISLAIDAMELHLTRPQPNYAILTNDADFTPLVLRLKEDGATVHGYGHNATPKTLRSAFNAFTQISDLRHKDGN
ncbi:NYN domain-containing protein [Cucumibacter marinus]|uniref:NYN domain-containing protein n=1 Tax=Cucumibacter marinus TaxID=1121252 RepID=UPI00048BBF32|nr:NYN domain-containing protein [Cucumibacter marinus]